MPETLKKKEKKHLGERALRVLRDFNIFVGGVALIGAAVVMTPVIAAGLTAYGELNLAQAGGYELLRQGVKTRKHKSKEKGKKDVIR